MVVTSACGGKHSSASESTSATTAASSKPLPQCTASDLTAALADSNTGGTSPLATIRFTNAGNRKCTLKGYAGVEITNLNGTYISGATTRTAATPWLTVPPNGLAFFDMYYSTQPAGVEICQPGTYMNITLPNDNKQLQVLLYLPTICKGPGISISPMRATKAGG
jgi:hypothetical protein